MAGPGKQKHRAIESALLEFERAPTRHAVERREPATLFDSLREVLLLADKRSLQDSGPPPAAAVVQAARFFLRTALLRTQANHYALLGLPTSADSAAVKERYRLMMRLLHPDFVSPAQAKDWPADAASRVNLAYEVLSSPERKHAYDSELSPPPPTASSPQRTAVATSTRAATNSPAAQDPRRLLRTLAMGFGAVGGLAVIAMWASSQGDGESLVQRAMTRPLSHVAQTSTSPVQDSPTFPAVSSSTNENISAPMPRSDSTGLAAALIAALPAFLASSASLPAAAAPVESKYIAVTATAPMAPPASFTVAAPMPPAQPVAPPETHAETAMAAPPPPPAPAAAPVRPPPVVAQAEAASAAVRPASSPVSAAMTEAQDQLMRIAGEIETGWGDNVLSGLGSSVRGTPGAQAIARQLDSLCEGARPVKVDHADFRGELRDGKLSVNGDILLRVRDVTTPTRQLFIHAEFTRVNGSLVLTRIEPAAH